MAATKLDGVREQIATILRDKAANRLINFQVGGIGVTPQELADVGDAVAAGRVKLKLDTQSEMGYNPYNDTFRVSSTDLSLPNTRGVVIHEAVHILNDMRATAIKRIDDETAAFIAHVIYLRVHDPRFNEGQSYESDGTPKGNLLGSLLLVANAIVGGATHLRSSRIDEIRDRVVKVPGYENSTCKTIKHNGLRKM